MKKKMKLSTIAFPVLLAMAMGCGDDNPVKANVTLAISVSGDGAVESNSTDHVIKCGKDADGNDLTAQTCSVELDEGESITLTATASNGSVFTIWNANTNGDEFTCTTANVCTVTLTKDTSASAVFVP